jgi:transcriptional regulator with XRE-family HTH domain
VIRDIIDCNIFVEGVNMKIGEKIRIIRKRKGLTQKELGERLGVSDMSVRRYENAENMQIDTLEKIANALNVPIGAFIVSSPYQKAKSIYDNNLQKDSYDEIVKQLMIFFDNMTDDERDHLFDFLQIYYQVLNNEGKERLFEYMHDLVKIPEYRNKGIEDKIDI